MYERKAWYTMKKLSAKHFKMSESSQYVNDILTERKRQEKTQNVKKMKFIISKKRSKKESMKIIKKIDIQSSSNCL